MPAKEIIISDSEPEREAIRKIRKQRKRDSSSDQNSSKRDSTDSLASTRRIPVPANAASGFQSAALLHYTEQRQQSPKPAPPVTMVIDLSESSQSGMLDAPQIALQPATSPVASTSKAAPIEVDSSDDGASVIFARSLSAKYAYKPDRNGSAASVSSASSSKSVQNLFAKSKSPDVSEMSAASSSKGKGKAKPVASAKEARLHVDLVGLLSSCPVCKKAWTARKSAIQKQTHILACADKDGWEDDTLLTVVGKVVRGIQVQLASEQSAVQNGKTLFDDVLHTKRKNKADVRVVGTDADAIAATQGGSIVHRASSEEVESELTRAKSKIKKTAAKPAKSSKLSKALKVLDQHAAVLSDHAAAQSVARNIGLLQSYTTSMHDISNKAEAIITADALPPTPKKRKIIPLDTDTSLEQIDNGPPSTQPLKPSRLLSAFPDKEQPRSKLVKTNGALWSLASGNDAAALSAHIENDSSSDSLPLSSHSHAHPQTNVLSQHFQSTRPDQPAAKEAGRRAAQNQTVAVSKLASTNQEEIINIPPMPDYSAWSLADLQAETGKYGYKASGTKKACILTLTRVWEALQTHSNRNNEAAGWTSSASENEKKSAKKVKKARKKKVTPVSADEDLSDDSKEDGFSAADISVDPLPTDFKAAMRRLTMQDKDLYHKILLYHPVPFETFVKMAKDNGLKASAITVRQFLDDQCITFYMDQSTGRNRQRKPRSPKKRGKKAAK